MKDYLKDVGTGIAKTINSIDIMGRKNSEHGEGSNRTADESIKVITDRDLANSTIESNRAVSKDVGIRAVSNDLGIQSGADELTLLEDDSLDEYSMKGLFRENKTFVAVFILTMGCAGF